MTAKEDDRWIRRCLKKNVKGVKSDYKSEEGENVNLQTRLSRRLLECLHWSFKLIIFEVKSSFVRKR